MYNFLQRLTLNPFLTRKGVPELWGPGLGCMSAIDAIENAAKYFVNITVLVSL